MSKSFSIKFFSNGAVLLNQHLTNSDTLLDEKVLIGRDEFLLAMGNLHDKFSKGVSDE